MAEQRKIAQNLGTILQAIKNKLAFIFNHDNFIL